MMGEEILQTHELYLLSNQLIHKTKSSFASACFLLLGVKKGPNTIMAEGGCRKKCPSPFGYPRICNSPVSFRLIAAANGLGKDQ
jgi:hypothetical protein